MKACAEILTLVEKLSDGEATVKEKLEAEAHLEICPGCRGHASFLASLAREARSVSFPEPPTSYWEHLPQRVLDRIDSESRRTFWGDLVAPAVLRWLALGGALLVAVAVSVSVLRDDARAPAPAAPPAAKEASPAVAPAAAEPEAEPPMARDEAAPPVARQSAPRPAAAPAEGSAASEAETGTADSNEPPRRRESAQNLARAARPGAELASSAVSSEGGIEDCDSLRRSIDSLAEEQPRAHARYRLALCSIRGYQNEATEELRKRAIEDAEAFLASEEDGPRADEIREKLRGIRPD
jgi:hypothetical protein